MAELAMTWWGQGSSMRLEGFTDSGRLQRGRGYSSARRILDFDIVDGTVTATALPYAATSTDRKSKLY